uniref:Uncharacterized protein n=1 Tax=Arion vulgaris TaxID=1028688 RepID=A0A0B7BEG9_9EUPU
MRSVLVLLYIKKQQVKWFRHISRLPQDSLPQRALALRYSRPRGRPCKRWMTEYQRY